MVITALAASISADAVQQSMLSDWATALTKLGIG